jgi:diacylglycerol kinase (ATP)
MRERIRSFGFAFEGLAAFFRTQHNAWIHLFAAIAAVCLGIYAELAANEWCWIVLAIVMVFIAELFNTAIEFLSDVVAPNIHPQIKKVKDISAAAVLLASLGAMFIGLIIFVPALWRIYSAG